MNRNNETNIDNCITANNDLDTMLYNLYESDNVPDHVNIALKNRITYEACHGNRKIELWWLPAVLNTTIAFMGIIFAIVFYKIAIIGGSHTIIPNMIGKVSEFSLKATLFWIVSDIFLGWLATFIVIPIASGRKFFGGVKML